MAIENPTASQVETAIKTLDSCTQGLAQKEAKLAEDMAKKAQQIVDETTQKLAQIPENIIGTIETAIDALLKIISGYENPEDPTFDPTILIGQIEILLKPVIAALSSLPVPSIPGLSDISKLLGKLSAAASSSMKDTKQAASELSSSGASIYVQSNDKLKRSDIPENILSIIDDLITSLQSLCTALPLVLITLIFQMLSTIIIMFKQVAIQIGVPPILFPLNLVPNCLAMMPSITNLAIQLPIKMNQAVKSIVRKKIDDISEMQVPNAPFDIVVPLEIPPCPKRPEMELLGS